MADKKQQAPDVPVYLFTGFLEAGKTKFIQETLEDNRFHKGERTLLLLCEDGVITADTAGRYLLTNQNLRFGDINWTFFIAGGVVVILIAIAYIVLKKRYWFW